MSKYTIKEFFMQLQLAVDHMEAFPELSYKRLAIKDRIDKSMNNYILNSLKFDNDISCLIRIKNKDVIYLANFLVFGLLVDDGIEYNKAYDKTIGKYNSFIENFLSKKLIKDCYFRKLNNHERDILRNLLELLISENIISKD